MQNVRATTTIPTKCGHHACMHGPRVSLRTLAQYFPHSLSFGKKYIIQDGTNRRLLYGLLACFSSTQRGTTQINATKPYEIRGAKHSHIQHFYDTNEDIESRKRARHRFMPKRSASSTATCCWRKASTPAALQFKRSNYCRGPTNLLRHFVDGRRSLETNRDDKAQVTLFLCTTRHTRHTRCTQARHTHDKEGKQQNAIRPK